MFDNFTEPDHLDSEKCAAINEGENGWSSENCDEGKQFMCRFKSCNFQFIDNHNLIF